MTRDSEEYKQFCAEYEAKEKERKDNERIIDVALEIIDKHMGGNNDDNN